MAPEFSVPTPTYGIGPSRFSWMCGTPLRSRVRRARCAGHIPGRSPWPLTLAIPWSAVGAEGGSAASGSRRYPSGPDRIDGSKPTPNRRCDPRLAPCPGKHVRAMLGRCRGRGLLPRQRPKCFGGAQASAASPTRTSAQRPALIRPDPVPAPAAQGIWSLSAALRAGELAHGGLGTFAAVEWRRAAKTNPSRLPLRSRSIQSGTWNKDSPAHAR